MAKAGSSLGGIGRSTLSGPANTSTASLRAFFAARSASEPVIASLERTNLFSSGTDALRTFQ